MITKTEIVENVLKAIRKTDNKKDRDMVEGFLQKHVFQISEQHSFHKLRQVMEVDLTGAGDFPEQGVWLPANLAGIDAVRDSDGRDLVRRDEAHIDPDEHTFRFFTYVPTSPPVYVGDDVVVSQGVDSFSSGELEDYLTDNTEVDVAGEWARFGSEYGFYQVGEQSGDLFDISPVYHGQSLAQEHFEIRPRGTQKLVIVKPNEDQVISGTVKVYYWTYHPPLHLNSDPVLFPHAGLLESIVIREALNNLGRRQLSSDKYIGDIREGWQITRRLNPTFPRQTGPRGRNNKTFEMNHSLFTRRE
jgi:hypothetical protein